MPEYWLQSLLTCLDCIIDLTATIEARQKLDYQQSESDLVLKVSTRPIKQSSANKSMLGL